MDTEQDPENICAKKNKNKKMQIAEKLGKRRENEGGHLWEFRKDTLTLWVKKNRFRFAEGSRSFPFNSSRKKRKQLSLRPNGDKIDKL